jgi:hypothetical protein
MTPAIGSCRKCGREVGEVHVGETVLYGHLQAPHPSHRVQLARVATDGFRKGSEDSRSLREGPHSRSGRSLAAASRQRTNATRGASDGRSRTAHPSGIRSKSPEQGRSQQDPSPAPASAQGLGPR